MLVDSIHILSKVTGHFFDPDTMRRFKSRTASTGYIVGTRGYLVVSSKQSEYMGREYRVSVTDLTTGRTTWANTNKYISRSAADTEAQRLAEEAAQLAGEANTNV